MPAHVHEPDVKRRIQLLMQQLEQLPTLSSIAVRLLEVTSSDDSDARDVVALISADPALSAKVIGLCRRASRGVNLKDGDLSRAVVLLGFDEVRAAALSVEVFELMQGMITSGGEQHSSEDAMFDATAYWRHCLATAVAAEMLVRETPLRKSIKPGEAFLGGLLHDLGQLALHTVLPRTFARICTVAETHAVDINRVCRKILGQGAGLFGKHLSEHWQLPDALTSVIWLCGESPETLPSCVQRDMVNLISLADQVARRQLLTHPGHGPADAVLEERLCNALKLSRKEVDRVLDPLLEEVATRAASIGIQGATSVEVMRESLEHASRTLERLQASRKAHSAAAKVGSRLAIAAERFYRDAGPGASLTTMLSAIAASFRALMQAMPQEAEDQPRALSGDVCMYLSMHDRAAELFRFDADSRVVATSQIDMRGEAIEPWRHEESVMLDGRDVVRDDIQPLLASVLQATALEHPRLLPLGCGPDTTAGIIFEGEFAGAVNDASLDVLRRMWGFALAASVSRERTAALSERLVDANRTLIEAQMSLAERRAMSALGELASGAAHEMNNPLTVISGRAQLLARKLSSHVMQNAAEEIVQQVSVLSNLITGLRMSADLTLPTPKTITVEEYRTSLADAIEESLGSNINTRIIIEPGIEPLHVDNAQINAAIIELVRNANEAAPGLEIRIEMQVDRLDECLMIRVVDRGPGLDENTLMHAFDPFFSRKSAGRQTGLGLPRARKLVELNHGTIDLVNAAASAREGRRGAIATIILHNWQAPAAPLRQVA
ncbi:MAG: HDOD domain-containing protein [Phycisphaerales bacterium]